MPVTRTLVKGIKYGTMQQYLAIESPNADMLYFITDKGLLYRGTSIVVPRNFITAQVSNPAVGQGEQYVTFRIETYGSDPANPVVLTFDVYSKTAVNNIVNTLNAAIAGHRTWTEGTGNEQTTVTADGKANANNYGHVRLSDTANASLDADSGYAATPKAVADAVANAIGDLAGAMVFKGTIGNAAAYNSTSIYNPGDYCTYNNELWRCVIGILAPQEWDPNNWTTVSRTVANLPVDAAVGDTYRVVAPGLYDEKRCEIGDLIICTKAASTAPGVVGTSAEWTVAQNNIDGAVTAADNLERATLIIGNGGREVRTFPNGVRGQFLRSDLSGLPSWETHLLSEHGIGYGECSARPFGTVAITDFVLKVGGLVSVAFTSSVGAGASINVNDTGAKPIFYNGQAITAGVIKNGDVGLFVYDGTHYTLLGLSRNLNDGSLSDFTNDIITHATCSTAYSTTQKTVASNGFTVAAGSILAVTFSDDVGANATLNVNGTGAKPIFHRSGSITDCAIRANDTATFVCDGTNWVLLGIDRGFDSVPTANSHNLVDSKAVYDFVEARTLYWEEM